MSWQQVAKAPRQELQQQVRDQAKPSRKSAAAAAALAAAAAAESRPASVSAVNCWVSAANRSQQSQSAHQSVSQPVSPPVRPSALPSVPVSRLRLSRARPTTYACQPSRFLVSLRLPEVSCKCNLLGAAIATVDVAGCTWHCHCRRRYRAAAATATAIAITITTATATVTGAGSASATAVSAASAASQRVMSIWQTNCRPFEAYSATVYCCPSTDYDLFDCAALPASRRSISAMPSSTLNSWEHFKPVETSRRQRSTCLISFLSYYWA